MKAAHCPACRARKAVLYAETPHRPTIWRVHDAPGGRLVDRCPLSATAVPPGTAIVEL